MNFEQFGKKVKKFSQDTVTEVQKMNEVRQLNAKVSDEKKLLNRLYLELGQKFYDRHRDAEIFPDGFEDDFRKIEERYSTMDLLKDQIREVKGVVLCPCCNMEVAATERYCSNCGNKMPEIIKIEDKAEDDDAIVIDARVVEPSEQETPVIVVQTENASEMTESAEDNAAETAQSEAGDAADAAQSEAADAVETVQTAVEDAAESAADNGVTETAQFDS